MTQASDEALGRFDFTILLVLPILVAHLFHIEGQHPMRARLDEGGRDHGMTKRHLAYTVLTL
jgi:hypothetical protein